MRLLILGGTQFVGRHMARAAAAAGHEVTLFNRGNAPEVLPELPRIRGDRDGGLAGLKGLEFDAVIDVNGYLPRLVRDAAALLEPRVGRYLFVSTISVYAGVSEPYADETAAVAELADPTSETRDAQAYGPLKALCERAVDDVFGAERSAIIRPGLVVGRFDPTDRFTYWVRRVWAGGELLAPGSANDPLQWVDVRDLASFAVRLVEDGASGIYNAVRPPDTVTMGELLAAAEVAADAAGRSGAGSVPTWVDADFLLEREVAPWSQLPAWLPARFNDMLRLSSARAVAAGLQTSELLDTITDVLTWDRERGLPPLTAGLTTELENTLLAEWREQGGVAG